VVSFPQASPPKPCMYRSPIRATRLSNMWSGVQIMKLLIVQYQSLLHPL
jgi:hypothetical protein